MENVTRQFQWCFPPFSHPAKGVSTAEYSTILCFGVLAVLMVMSTTGQQLGDFYHQINGSLQLEQQNVLGQPVASAIAPQGLSIGSVPEPLKNNLTSGFFAASESDDMFQALPQKQQTVSLANGHQIVISQPEDAAVLETLGPNGLVNSRLAMLNQIASELEAQGISTQEIDEIKEVALKGHEIAQFRRLFSDFWTVETRFNEYKANSTSWNQFQAWRSSLGANAHFITLNGVSYSLKDMHAHYATRQYVYANARNHVLRKCDTLANASCVKRVGQNATHGKFNLDQQLAYRQLAMESALTSNGQTELRDYLTKTTNDIWSLSSTSFLQMVRANKVKATRSDKSADKSNEEIHQRANTICGSAQSRQCFQ